MEWGFYYHEVWVTRPSDMAVRRLPPIDIDDTLNAHQMLQKAKTLSDLFGDLEVRA